MGSVICALYDLLCLHYRLFGQNWFSAYRKSPTGEKQGCVRLGDQPPGTWKERQSNWMPTIP
jgi:hypothetical protein